MCPLYTDVLLCARKQSSQRVIFCGVVFWVFLPLTDTFLLKSSAEPVSCRHTPTLELFPKALALVRRGGTRPSGRLWKSIL